MELHVVQHCLNYKWIQLYRRCTRILRYILNHWRMEFIFHGVLTLTGYDTRRKLEAALESITYNNISENPSTVNRTISWSVVDERDDSDTAETTITVSAVNDAPIASGSPALAAVTEDTTTPAGDTVASLFGDSFPISMTTPPRCCDHRKCRSLNRRCMGWHRQRQQLDGY